MDNIEEIFKSSLENAEMPYAPSAWETMQAKLDQKMPVKATKPAFSSKWAWVASIIVAGGIATGYFLLPAKSKTEAPLQTQTQIPTEEAQTPAQAPAAPKATQPTAQQSVADQNQATDHAAASAEAKQQPVHFTHHASKTSAEAQKNTPNKTTAPAESAGIAETIANKLNPISNAGGNNPGNAAVKMILPKVSAVYCEGEKIQLKNNNASALLLLSENGNSEVLDAKKAADLKLTESGNYYFQYAENGNVKKEFAFKVWPAAHVDFTFDSELLYNDGVPVTPFKALYPSEYYVWSLKNGSILSFDREFDAHFFTRGQQEVTLTVKDINGCESTLTKTLSVPEDYNLMAVTGFDPFSKDPKLISFMPFALTVRDVSFNMIIVDMKDGGVVYKTMDASKPWDGIDMRTGQMVPSGTPYAWKVTIANPEKFERPEYKGTITRK